MTQTHLTADARAVMGLPTEARVAFALEDHWIGYTRADQALQALNDLMHHPRILRMPNLLLVGESGNGKSTIASRFMAQHPVAVDEQTGLAIAPVISMNMPSEPSETRFWTELLLAMRIAHRDTDQVQRKKDQAFHMLATFGCRMLVIDEIHNLLHGHARQQRHFLGVLKNLSNDLKLPIVSVGTRDAIRALHTDTQLSSRFEAFGLPRWKLDREFLRLVASFERLLPLAEPSDLASRELAIKLHGMCGGTIGGLSRILKRAAAHAIREGKERIDAKVLDQIEWVRLTDYGKQANQL